MRLKPVSEELPWDRAAQEVAAALRRKPVEGLAVAASGALSNEDWLAFKELFVDTLQARRFLFAPEPDQAGTEDQLLRRREKTPNLEGGKALGFGTKIESMGWDALARDIEAGKVWGLYVIDRDPAQAWGDRSRELLERLDLLIYQGPRQCLAGELAHYRLPATAWLEEEGHFTNFQGKVQGYRSALQPLGAAKPDWAIFADLERRFKP